MQAARALPAMVFLLCTMALACADGGGSGGFDMTDRAQLLGASELAVSNLQNLIDFGQQGESGGVGAESAATEELVGTLSDGQAAHEPNVPIPSCRQSLSRHPGEARGVDSGLRIAGMTKCAGSWTLQAGDPAGWASQGKRKISMSSICKPLSLSSSKPCLRVYPPSPAGEGITLDRRANVRSGFVS